MIAAYDVVETMWEQYHAAVNANDSSAYRTLFVLDASRVPPASQTQQDPAETAKREHQDDDVEKWICQSSPIDQFGLSIRQQLGVATL